MFLFQVHVPMKKADKNMGGPNFTVPVECYLNLTQLGTERRSRYEAPNKLMQIQWLAILTSPPRSPVKKLINRPNIETAAAPEVRLKNREKYRIPRKLSVLQEKCLVDIFGLIVPLWINVVWEYNDHGGIRRRYEDPVRC